MRIYSNFQEAISEVSRDLAEMGILVHPKSYQDKIVEGDSRFTTMELQNYIYTVTDPRCVDLSPSQPWADLEFGERISKEPINPGEAYLTRKDIWDQFLIKDEYGRDKFAYTYAERLHNFNQIESLISTMKNDKSSRQGFISIWEQGDITRTGGISRIPCSLGYLFQIRRDRLNMTYLQRSSDFVTHFTNDVYLATKLQSFICTELKKSMDLEMGGFTHWVGSLHAFKKDLSHIF